MLVHTGLFAALPATQVAHTFTCEQLLHKDKGEMPVRAEKRLGSLMIVERRSACSSPFPVMRWLSRVAVAVIACTVWVSAQDRKLPAPGPMVDGGRVALQSSALTLELLTYSGTAAALSPRSDRTWDYTPSDRLVERSADTFYHLGDLDLRVRARGASSWTMLSTAYHRAPVTVVATSPKEFSADVSASLPAGTPLKLVRTWAVDGGELVLRFTLTNTSGAPLEVGDVGLAMVFNNILSGRTLEQAYGKCSFYDPYIGEDAGYVQVVPLKGTGPVLLVLPDAGTPLEGWKPILDHRSPETGLGLPGNDPTPRGTTFEGSFDWMVHSAAMAETEGNGVEQWNPPTAALLAPNQELHFGVRFVVAPAIRQIESTLAQHGRPVAVGIPGYTLPEDVKARLFLNSPSPVRSVRSEPEGAVTVQDDGMLPSRLHAYTLQGRQWGRSRLLITYADGSVQAIAYRTIKPEREAVTDLGHFLFQQQWFTDASDPFHRAPSIISYNNQAGHQVTQEPRVWIAGLSDEAGAGSWIAAAMKETLAPDAAEISKLDDFIDGVVWGHLQVSSGEHKFGVHKSLFFYQPSVMPSFPYNSSFDWSSWTSWNQAGAEDVGRSYNYPHVVALYWTMYRLARNHPGLATHHPWQWYLDQAFGTAMAAQSQAPYYMQFGQMEGTIFLRLLEDLRDEGRTVQAGQLEHLMRDRTDVWKDEPFPFGSEMPWDSTGQEEVYDWTRFFGFDAKAEVTLNAVLAYTPVVPSWGYNGSSRRYWDFLYAGKYPRIERQLHHYGSGLNAIPLLTEYRLHPTDLYLLRAGYAGATGPLNNIDEKGFASAAFHSFPDKMAFDPYSGDYGPNLFGHTMNTATYLVHDDAMGWLAFGGNVEERAGVLHLRVLDSARSRVFFAPLDLGVTLKAGEITMVDYDPRAQSIRLHLAPATRMTKVARLTLERLSGDKTAAGWKIAHLQQQSGNNLDVPLGAGETLVELTPARP